MPEAPSLARPVEESLARTWRPQAVELFDSTFVRFLFGAMLPFLWVLGMVALQAVAPDPRVWFSPTSVAAHCAIMVCAACLAAWAIGRPTGRLVNRFLAVMLGVGSALAIVYAVLFWLLVVMAWGHVIRTFSDSDGAGFFLLLLTICALIVSLTAAIFLRGATLAWRASGPPGHTRPWTSLGITAGAVYAACVGIVLLSQFFHARAMAHLGTDGPQAVEAAMGSLRAAAMLRGEDWIVENIPAAPEDSHLRKNLDEAFLRLTGTTASERARRLD